MTAIASLSQAKFRSQWYHPASFMGDRGPGTWAKICYLPRYISREPDWKWGRQTLISAPRWNFDVTDGRELRPLCHHERLLKSLISEEDIIPSNSCQIKTIYSLEDFPTPHAIQPTFGLCFISRWILMPVRSLIIRALKHILTFQQSLSHSIFPEGFY